MSTDYSKVVVTDIKIPFGSIAVVAKLDYLLQAFIHAVLVFLLGISFFSFPTATEANMEGAMDLKSLLRRDFGYDLNISGGFGQSQGDPIIIMEPNGPDAALTEMLVLRGIGKGRGILWRTLGRKPLKQNGIVLDQVKIETKAVSEREIVTQKENYYFNVSAAAQAGNTLPNAVGWLHREAGLIIPYEIGWLHFDNAIDNEPVFPGLGQSLFYGAPGIKATIYIYDKGLSKVLKDTNRSVIKEEFNSSISDFMKLHPESIALGDSLEKGSMVYKKFLISQDLSIVAVSVMAGKFVKLRMTSLNDPDFADLADQSLSAFQDLVASGGIPSK